MSRRPFDRANPRRALPRESYGLGGTYGTGVRHNPVAWEAERRASWRARIAAAQAPGEPQPRYLDGPFHNAIVYLGRPGWRSDTDVELREWRAAVDAARRRLLEDVPYCRHAGFRRLYDAAIPACEVMLGRLDAELAARTTSVDRRDANARESLPVEDRSAAFDAALQLFGLFPTVRTTAPTRPRSPSGTRALPSTTADPRRRP